MLTAPDFNRLHIFYFVYKSQSIQKAADELHVTRSAVSQHITNLEKELKTPLFVRTNKSLIPTSQADVLFQTMAPFIQSLNETLGNLEKGRREPFGILRIGAPAELGSNHLVPIISSFRKKYPLVRFKLNFAIPPILCEAVCKNEIDFALIDAGDFFEKLYPISVKEVLDEAQVLACSKRYYEQHIKGDHSFLNLVKAQYVSHVAQSTELRLWFKHHLNKNPTDFDLTLVCENILGIKNAVKGDFGLGLLPVRLIRDELETEKLIKIPTTKKDYINKIMLAQLPERKPTLTEKTFLDVCLNHFTSLEN